MASYMLLLHRATERPPQFAATPDAVGKVTREYIDWADRVRALGHLKAGSKLTDDPGKILRSGGGRVSTTDGPFAESKELIGGYAVYDVKSKNEAIEWTSRFMQLHKEHWPGWEGESEVRQISDAPSGGQAR